MEDTSQKKNPLDNPETKELFKKLFVLRNEIEKNAFNPNNKKSEIYWVELPQRPPK